jgi:hypothetical protein
MEPKRRRLIDGTVAGLVATMLLTGPLLFIGPLSPPLLAAHVLYGAFAGGVYGIAVEPGSLGRAVLYGLLLWAVALAVYAPLCGFGFLAARAPRLAAAALPLHLLWGLLVGAFQPRTPGAHSAGARPMIH